MPQKDLREKSVHGYYGPESVTWKVTRESAVLLGGSRAILMQIAHPLVAIGVEAHSSYRTDPLGRANRTFLLGEHLTFGNSTQAQQAARTINRLHTHVHGELPLDAGSYQQGAHYSAKDQDLLLWVHATLIDSLLLAYKLLWVSSPSRNRNNTIRNLKRLADY